MPTDPIPEEIYARLQAAIDSGLGSAWALRANREQQPAIAGELVTRLSPTVGPVTRISVSSHNSDGLPCKGLWILEEADELEGDIRLSGWIKTQHDIHHPFLKMIFLGENLKTMMNDRRHPLFHFYGLMN